MPLFDEKRDLDAYPKWFKVVTTSLEGVTTGQESPEGNFAPAPNTHIVHTQYNKLQFDEAENRFMSKNPTGSMKEHFCYSASWRPNAVRGEVSVPQNGCAARALLGCSCNNGGCSEKNSRAAEADTTLSAPPLVVTDSRGMARGHLDDSLEKAGSLACWFGKGNTHERRAGIFAEVGTVDLP